MLLNELLKASKWSGKQAFFRLSKDYSDDCKLSILELLETKGGRERVRSLIRNLKADD
ncbi:hypothetical protein [Idiomarina abyssalis]|uniref:hypothetical protein n=1 Tax=Idiomarina abyssalis TaxID=86102 RepID=UPI003A91AD12